jgi:hypothetical protein
MSESSQQTLRIDDALVALLQSPMFTSSRNNVEKNNADPLSIAKLGLAKSEISGQVLMILRACSGFRIA